MSTPETKRVRRVFMHGSLRLADPNPAATTEQVKAILAQSYPDLTNATLTLKESKDGTEVWEFKRAVATKG